MLDRPDSPRVFHNAYMIAVRAELPSPCQPSMTPSGRWGRHMSRISLSIHFVADATRSRLYRLIAPSIESAYSSAEPQW